MAHIVKENGRTILRDDWYIEDVLEQAEDMEVKLTKKQAEKVLDLMCETFDCNIGINWEVIEECIRTIKGESK
jgi:hypothetical protein